MTPMFVDMAVESLDAPPPMRKPVAVAIGFPDGGDLVTEFAFGDDVPKAFAGTVRKVGGGKLRDGSSANDLRLVGWDMAHVWQTLNGMALRSRFRLYDWHHSVYEKWSRMKFGDLRLIATQGWYCDDLVFEEYANWLLGSRLTPLCGDILRDAGGLREAMEERVFAMAEMWRMYGEEDE